MAPSRKPADLRHVRWLWPTHIYQSTARLPAAKRALFAARASAAAGSVVTDPFIQTEMKRFADASLRRHLRAYGGIDEHKDPLVVSCRTLALGGGRYQSSAPGAGRHTALFWLSAGIGSDPARISGRLLLRDPRAGCANVFAPGHPFGRSLLIAPRSGRIVIFPSFLPFAITPVARGDSVLVAIFSIWENPHRDSGRHVA